MIRWHLGLNWWFFMLCANLVFYTWSVCRAVRFFPHRGIHSSSKSFHYLRIEKRYFLLSKLKTLYALGRIYFLFTAKELCCLWNITRQKSKMLIRRIVGRDLKYHSPNKMTCSGSPFYFTKGRYCTYCIIFHSTWEKSTGGRKTQ